MCNRYRLYLFMNIYIYIWPILVMQLTMCRFFWPRVVFNLTMEWPPCECRTPHNENLQKIDMHRIGWAPRALYSKAQFHGENFWGKRRYCRFGLVAKHTRTKLSRTWIPQSINCELWIRFYLMKEALPDQVTNWKMDVPNSVIYLN